MLAVMEPRRLRARHGFVTRLTHHAGQSADRDQGTQKGQGNQASVRATTPERSASSDTVVLLRTASAAPTARESKPGDHEADDQVPQSEQCFRCQRLGYHGQTGPPTLTVWRLSRRTR